MRYLLLIAVSIVFFVVPFLIATYIFKSSSQRRKRHHCNTPIRRDGLRLDSDLQPSRPLRQHIYNKDDL